MLNNLRLLQNVGQFDSVSTGAGLQLAKLALGYAENGRGKTTLSSILRSLATNDPVLIRERHRLGATHAPRVIVDCAGGPPHAMYDNGAWNRHVPDIAIFDDAFVDQNICSGLAIDAAHRQHLHEFILGAQGVTLNLAVQTQVQNIETISRSLRDLAAAIPETARFGVPVEQFCSLPPNPEVDDAIRDAERAVAAASQQDAIRAGEDFRSFSLPEVDVEAIRTLLGRTLEGLDQTATNQVQQHFASLGRGGEQWVENGIGRIPGDLDHAADKPCPFCAQDLGGSELVNHYRSYFAASYADHKQATDAMLQQFVSEHSSDAQLYLARIVRLWGEARGFWSQFTDVPEVSLDVDAIQAAWTNMRDAIKVALEAKRAAPLDRIELSADASRAIEQYRLQAASIARLSEQLQQTKSAIELVKERAATANMAALKSDLSQLQATKSRHSHEIAPLCDNYQAENRNKLAAEAARDAARAALNQYRTNIFPAYQVAINDCLRRFNAGFRLDSVTSNNTRGGSSCTYNVLINNQSIAVSATNTPAGAPSFKSWGPQHAGTRHFLRVARSGHEFGAQDCGDR
ncbi:AAA family ATPase [Bradyrhizobium acaciae]|uniref:AAA family ATPase n=1 Tax=Bradyrhizobium acaciae TaxID=2683706 RepID=UPI001E4A9D14|nr:hypothetical protein [Bradyrhizobium acaciae]